MDVSSVSFAYLFLKLNSHLRPDREGLAATGWRWRGGARRAETDLGVDPTKSVWVVLGQVTSLEREQLISNPDRA